jgi:hypothetical protein
MKQGSELGSRGAVSAWVAVAVGMSVCVSSGLAIRMSIRMSVCAPIDVPVGRPVGRPISVTVCVTVCAPIDVTVDLCVIMPAIAASRLLRRREALERLGERGHGGRDVCIFTKQELKVGPLNRQVGNRPFGGQITVEEEELAVEGGQDELPPCPFLSC